MASAARCKDNWPGSNKLPARSEQLPEPCSAQSSTGKEARIKNSASLMAAAIFTTSILATGCASVGGDGPYDYKSSGGIGDHGYSETRHNDIRVITWPYRLRSPGSRRNISKNGMRVSFLFDGWCKGTPGMFLTATVKNEGA